MHDNEALQMMKRCSEEIRVLRRQVERLQPKADAYDNIAVVLNLLPRPSVSMGEDIAWRLDQKIKEIEQKAQGGDDAAVS